MIRIVIADSNHLIRAGLNAVLSQYDDFELVGEADSSEKLIDLVRHFRPDVVLVDFAARDFSVDVVQRCLRVSPQSRLVAITPEQSGVTIVVEEESPSFGGEDASLQCPYSASSMP